MATPDSVKQYLTSKNINSALKWITTELVIHKPDDPLQFIHNLTKLALSQTGYEYSSDLIESFIQQEREKSDVDVENEAKILKQPVSIATTNNTGLKQDLSRIVDSMREIATELNPKKTTQIMTQQASKLLQCEKTIFLSYDAEKQTFQMNSDDASNQDLKLSVNQEEITARCVAKSEFEIIDNVLCCPLKDFDTGEVYGMFQAINKENEAAFTRHDVDLLNALGTIGQITLQNGIIYELGLTEKKRNESMLALWRHLNDKSKVFNINSLLFTITRRCLEIVDAEKCTFYFVDQQSKELWSMQGDVNIRMAIDKGIAGLCATNGEILNIPNVYEHPQFDKEHDEKTGFVTKAMLVVPMKGNEKDKIIGVIQLINKRGMIDVFEKKDEQILELVLSAASIIVEQNQGFFTKINENQQPSSLGKVSPTQEERFVSDLSRESPDKRAEMRAHSLSHDIGALVEEEEHTSETDTT
eukprot:261619_1